MHQPDSVSTVETPQNRLFKIKRSFRSSLFVLWQFVVETKSGWCMLYIVRQKSNQDSHKIIYITFLHSFLSSQAHVKGWKPKFNFTPTKGGRKNLKI